MHRLSVFGTDEVGHGLGLGLVVVRSVRAVVNVVVVVVVVAVLGTDVLHLVDGTALGATLDGAVAGGGEPDDNVRVGRVAGAANVLLIAEGLDGDGVVERSCVLLAQPFPRHVGSEPCIVLGGALRHPLLPGQTHSFVLQPPNVRTLPASIKRAHVEDINTLHLSKNFETLETSSLLEIGGHGTRLSTLGEKVGLGSDLYSARKRKLSAKKNHIRYRSVAPVAQRQAHIRGRHAPRPMGARRTTPSFQRCSGRLYLLTVERLDVLGRLAGLGVSVGAAVD